MSKRRQLAHLLHATGTLGAILKLRARTSPPWLSVLTYHRFPTTDRNEPFDDGVIDVTLERFERQAWTPSIFGGKRSSETSPIHTFSASWPSLSLLQNIHGT
jgi:hypothetical protein